MIITSNFLHFIINEALILISPLLQNLTGTENKSQPQKLHSD